MFQFISSARFFAKPQDSIVRRGKGIGCDQRANATAKRCTTDAKRRRFHQVGTVNHQSNRLYDTCWRYDDWKFTVCHVNVRRGCMQQQQQQQDINNNKKHQLSQQQLLLPCVHAEPPKIQQPTHTRALWYIIFRHLLRAHLSQNSFCPIKFFKVHTWKVPTKMSKPPTKITYISFSICSFSPNPLHTHIHMHTQTNSS